MSGAKPTYAAVSMTGMRAEGQTEDDQSKYHFLGLSIAVQDATRLFLLYHIAITVVAVLEYFRDPETTIGSTFSITAWMAMSGAGLGVSCIWFLFSLRTLHTGYVLSVARVSSFLSVLLGVCSITGFVLINKFNSHAGPYYDSRFYISLLPLGGVGMLSLHYLLLFGWAGIMKEKNTPDGVLDQVFAIGGRVALRPRN